MQRSAATAFAGKFMYASGDMAVKTGALDDVQLGHAQCHEAASNERGLSCFRRRHGAPRRPLREEFMYASGDMAVKIGALDGVQVEHA